MNVFYIAGGLGATALVSFPIWRTIRADLGGVVGWKKPNGGQYVVLYILSMIWSAAVLSSALGVVIYMFRQTTLRMDSGILATVPFYILFFIVAGLITLAGRHWLRWLAGCRQQGEG